MSTPRFRVLDTTGHGPYIVYAEGDPAFAAKWAYAINSDWRTWGQR